MFIEIFRKKYVYRNVFFTFLFDRFGSVFENGVWCWINYYHQHFTFSWIDFKSKQIGYSDRMSSGLNRDLEHLEFCPEHIMTKGLASYLDSLMLNRYNFMDWKIILIDKYNGTDRNERQNDGINCGIIALAQCFMMATTGEISTFTQDDFGYARNMYASFLVEKLSRKSITELEL